MKLNLVTPVWALPLMAAITNASPVSQFSPRTDDRERVYTESWAGLGIETTTDSPISALTGVIQANVSFAIHLGTNGDYGSGAAAGIDMAIAQDRTATFASWSQSYDVSGRETRGVNWMDEMRGSRFDIQPGDEIAINFKTLGHSNVMLQWRNLRTSDNMQLKIKNYKAELCLTHAAWLTEIRPAFTTKEPGDPANPDKPDFGTVVLKGLERGTEDGKVWNAGERKGPAKEKWYAIGTENDGGIFVNTQCGFFERAEDIDEHGMKCTQGKL